LKMAAALMLLWHNRGRWSEGIHWLSQGLALEEKIAGDEAVASLTQSNAWILAKALSTAGFLLEEQWEDAKAKLMFEKSLTLYQEFDPENSGGIAFALYGLGVCAYDLGDFADAQGLFARSRGLYEKIGDRWGGSECLFFMVDLENDLSLKKGTLQEILTDKKEIGDIDGIAYALKNLSIHAFNTGDVPGAQSLAEESLELFRVVGDKQSEAKMLNHLGSILHLTGDYQRASQLHEEAMAIYKSIGDDIHYAFWLINLSRLCLSRGNSEEARLDIENALHTSQQTGNKRVIGRALLNKAWLYWVQGERLQAAKEIEKALELGRETGYKPVLAIGYYLSGLVASTDGNIHQAALMLKESLMIYLEIHNPVGRVDALEALAGLAIQEQKPERAARLFGAANLPYNGLHINYLSPIERTRHEEALTMLRQLLGEERFAENWQAGLKMTPEQADAYALGF
jgi:tetratricopeptide (TPR) repeat protein